jgi:hypothetical protein
MPEPRNLKPAVVRVGRLATKALTMMSLRSARIGHFKNKGTFQKRAMSQICTGGGLAFDGNITVLYYWYVCVQTLLKPLTSCVTMKINEETSFNAVAQHIHVLNRSEQEIVL